MTRRVVYHATVLVATVGNILAVIQIPVSYQKMMTNLEYFYFIYFPLLNKLVIEIFLLKMFQFDELSHKSSGSSLNLAGSSQASGQGSLENLGGGELLRQNSMKRSGSSVSSLQSRAVPSASSRYFIHILKCRIKYSFLFFTAVQIWLLWQLPIQQLANRQVAKVIGNYLGSRKKVGIRVYNFFAWLII